MRDPSRHTPIGIAFRKAERERLVRLRQKIGAPLDARDYLGPVDSKEAKALSDYQKKKDVPWHVTVKRKKKRQSNLIKKLRSEIKELKSKLRKKAKHKRSR